ncbi:hypothetical protein [Hymenobacter sp. B81]|uniref:hypothetical protein n=1 Tax=Hymenobacter sp. B81 TaxID=3344878 RepID=UPI0037DCEC40
MPQIHPPITEQYSVELQAFRDAGWDAWFGFDPDRVEARLYGSHVASGLKFFEEVPREYLSMPQLMPTFIERALARLTQEVAKKYGLPALVHINPVTGEHWPVESWERLQRVLGGQPTPGLEQRISDADFRRRHKLCLATTMHHDANPHGPRIVEGDMFELDFLGSLDYVYVKGNRTEYGVTFELVTHRGHSIRLEAVTYGAKYLGNYCQDKAALVFKAIFHQA